LWYAHKNISPSLRLATKITDIIFTASEKSFRLSSKKIKVMGHGIDTEKFSPAVNVRQDNFFNIVTIGRISPVKKYEDLINVIEELSRDDQFRYKIKVSIVGGAIDALGEKYFSELKNLVKTKKLEDLINFVGPVNNDQVVNILRNSDLFVHMSQTGSLDKAVLEAMACEVLALSNNESVVNDVLGDYKGYLCYTKNNLKNKIEEIMKMSDERRKSIKNDLRTIIINKHKLEALIKNIILNLENK